MNNNEKFLKFIDEKATQINSCSSTLKDVKNKFIELFPVKEKRTVKAKEFTFHDAIKKLCIIAKLSNDYVPIFENIFLRNDGMMIATNLEIAYYYQTEFKGKDATIPYEILKTINKDEQILKIEFDSKTFKGIIKTSIRNINFHGQDPLEFVIDMEVGDIVDSFELNQSDINIAKSLIPICGTDFLRPVMAGVYFGEEFAATDAHLLSWIKPTASISKNFILPKIYIPFLFEGSASTFKKDKENLNPQYLKVVNENGQILIVRLTDGKYPDYRAVIPKQNPITVKFNKADLINSIKMLIPYTNTETGLVIMTVMSHQNSVSFFAEDIDTGKELNLSVSKIESNGEIRIGFCAKMMIKLLELVNEKEISFEMSMPNRAILINGNSLIMPCMLNS